MGKRKGVEPGRRILAAEATEFLTEDLPCIYKVNAVRSLKSTTVKPNSPVNCWVGSGPSRLNWEAKDGKCEQSEYMHYPRSPIITHSGDVIAETCRTISTLIYVNHVI